MSLDFRIITPNPDLYVTLEYTDRTKRSGMGPDHTLHLSLPGDMDRMRELFKDAQATHDTLNSLRDQLLEIHPEEEIAIVGFAMNSRLIDLVPDRTIANNVYFVNYGNRSWSAESTTHEYHLEFTAVNDLVTGEESQ
jgi:hypothetical protein